MDSIIEWILVTTDNLNKQSSQEHIVINTSKVTPHINKESFNKELDIELRNVSTYDIYNRSVLIIYNIFQYIV